jgi:hypothetical protein
MAVHGNDRPEAFCRLTNIIPTNVEDLIGEEVSMCKRFQEALDVVVSYFL